jgi:parallel beta-helix repeat protein
MVKKIVLGLGLLAILLLAGWLGRDFIIELWNAKKDGPKVSPLEAVLLNLKKRAPVVADIADSGTPAQPVFLGDFFVDPTRGDDSNDGRSPSTAKKTFASAYQAASPGARIALLRGDTLHEEIRLDKRIRLLPYPYNGSEPAVLSGYETLSVWTNEGAGLYSASPATRLKSYPNSVLIKRVNYPQGRKPEFGWFNLTSVDPNSQSVSASEISRLGFLDQAEAIVKTSYRLFYSDITSVRGEKAFYTDFKRRDGQQTYVPESGDGIAFTRDKAFCDDYGEWVYDPSANKLYVYFGSLGPTNVQLSTLDIGVQIEASARGSIVEGLEIVGFNYAGVNTRSSDRNTVKACRFLYNENGVDYSHSSGTLIRDNYFESSSTNAIRAEFGGQDRGSGVRIIGNTIRNTGLWDQMIQTGAGGEPAIAAYNDEARVDSNTITHFGYIGINYLGSNCRIRYNTLDSGMLLLNDGGAIYCYENGDIDQPGMCYVQYNTISHIFGNFSGTRDGAQQAFGIYTDDGTDEHFISHNSISRVATAGYFAHNANRIHFEDNHVYDCGGNLVFIRSHSADNITYELNFNRNRLEHLAENGMSVHGRGAAIQFVYSQSQSTPSAIWRGDYNEYCLDITQGSLDDLGQCCSFNSTHKLDLAVWQSVIGGDQNATVSGCP